MRLLNKFGTLIYISRPWNWLRMQVPATVLGILYGLYWSGYQYSNILGEILEAMIAVAAISAGGYIINDYFDKDIDSINEPNRPIPSGKIREEVALIASIAFFSIGLLFSFFIGYLSLVIAIIWVLFAICYAYALKRRGYGFESFIFGLVMGLTVIFGSVTILRASIDIPILLLGGFMMLYMTAAHATGTLKDVEGDSMTGCKTVAIMLGRGRTRHLILLMYLLSFVILLYFIYFYLRFNYLLLTTAIVITIVFISNAELLSISNRHSIAKALSLSKNFLYIIFILLGIQLVLGSS